MSGIGIADRVLDCSVIAGYTSVGYRIRDRAWDAGDLTSMDGRVVLVTGATSGIGRAAAEGFAKLGAAVRILARDPRRGELARDEIVEHSGNGDVEVELCDLSDLAAIRAFAARFSARATRLDVLVNNAGVLTGERSLSPDGIELTFATNVLGPFLLTNTLSELLERSAPSRVINVSSGGMYTQRLHVEDLQMAGQEFDGAVAYARTKRIEVILTEMWAQRLKDTGVVVHAMHPGWVDTPGLRSSLPAFRRLMRPLLRDAEQGADTVVWLATAPRLDPPTGGFWHDREPRPQHRLPSTQEGEADRRRLWATCELLTTLGRRSAEPAVG